MVHLHGEIEPSDSAVITRQDYRRRLHESPGYLTFLRSVMASYTILYLGFSFTDAYLNELRSEVRSMLGSNASGPQPKSPKKPQEAPRTPRPMRWWRTWIPRRSATSSPMRVWR